MVVCGRSRKHFGIPDWFDAGMKGVLPRTFIRMKGEVPIVSDTTELRTEEASMLLPASTERVPMPSAKQERQIDLSGFHSGEEEVWLVKLPGNVSRVVRASIPACMTCMCPMGV